MIRADYTYELLGKNLSIEDLNLGRMSVTNCIEDIVDEISKAWDLNPLNLTIVYKDSEGVWDGWDHMEQNFIFLNCDTAEEAFKKLINKKNETL